ncbi:hypothetical protein EDB89DRAFT_185096 [Lactarius sanguifluus]|nr:hypothetical protein EDB89DRAFT_185096 [Lactarius sanguifluus]
MTALQQTHSYLSWLVVRATRMPSGSHRFSHLSLPVCAIMSQHLEQGNNAALQSLHHSPPNISESNDAQDQAQLEVIDGSEAIFNMYLEMSLREDKEMVESWNQDAKSILLFSGLFSATVAALGPSVPNLTASSQSNQISYFSLVSFELVNSLWYTSLVISLTCALLAILLQQWARRYLMAVRQRGTLCNQARIREFLAEGIRDSGIVLLVDVMWASHQFSFLLFILGLLVYFWHDDHATFSIILTWSLLWLCLYLWISVVGILRMNSPYYTPLSSLLLRLPQLTLAPMAPYALTRSCTGYSTRAAASNRVEEILRTRKAIEESVQKLLQDRDSHTLKWTFNSLNQDHEFERFFAGIPDFCNSRAVKNPVRYLLDLNRDEQKLSQALAELMHRTGTSHLISEPARQQRIKICAKAIDAVPTLASWPTLRRVFGEWEAFLGSVDFGSAVLLTGGDRNSDPRTVFCARCITAIVIARARVHDGRWIDLATQFLTSDMKLWVYISQPILQSYPEHGYTAPLQIANLIFVTRIVLQFYSQHQQDTSRDIFDISSKTLLELSSNIDVRDMSSEMQHEYCDLWNGLVRQARAEAQEGAGSYTPKIAADILGHLRRSHIALHDSTDAPLSHSSDDDDLFSPLGSPYPLCSVQNHRCTPPQTPCPITTNHTDTHTPRSSLSAPQNTFPAIPADATEDATPGLPVAPSTPKPPSTPLDAHLLVEMTNVQESYDAPVVQLDRLETPSLAPDVGLSNVSETTPLPYEGGGA